MERAEDILADEIEIYTASRLFAIIDDLQSLIDQGILKQVGGTDQLKDIKQLGSLELIHLIFETVPGRTRYYISFHGGGVFKKGNLEEDSKNRVAETLKARGAK